MLNLEGRPPCALLITEDSFKIPTIFLNVGCLTPVSRRKLSGDNSCTCFHFIYPSQYLKSGSLTQTKRFRKKSIVSVSDAEMTQDWLDKEISACRFADERLEKRFRNLIEKLWKE